MTRHAVSISRIAAVLLIAALLVSATSSISEASWFLQRLREAGSESQQQEEKASPRYLGGWARFYLQLLNRPAPADPPQTEPEKPADPALPVDKPPAQAPSEPGGEPPPQEPEEPVLPETILGRRVPAGFPNIEAAMRQLVDNERLSRGIPALVEDPLLTKLARIKSQDMVDNRYFAHTSPTLGSPFEMMRSAGVSYRRAGENLASAGNVHVAHYRLMDSSGHRATILNSRYTHIGIGIVPNGRGIMVTQLFVGR